MHPEVKAAFEDNLCKKNVKKLEKPHINITGLGAAFIAVVAKKKSVGFSPERFTVFFPGDCKQPPRALQYLFSWGL